MKTNTYFTLEAQLNKLARHNRQGSYRTKERMLGRALDRPDYILAFYLARYVGFQIHECMRIDTAIARQAIREGAITIKGAHLTVSKLLGHERADVTNI